MIREALAYIDPWDRETWYRVGMAVKDELGDAGFDLWDEWSQQADNYKAADARTVWRSFRSSGITIATLYRFARDNGYRGEGGELVRAMDPAARARREREQAEEEARHAEGQARAAKRAMALLGRAEYRWHPYLVSKGFPEEKGLCLDEVRFTRDVTLTNQLLIPMRDMDTHRVISLQMISEDGSKKFLPMSRTKGGIFPMGSGAEVYLCEGYATALSVRAALKSLFRQACVVVCFSAANVAHVASRLGKYVVADHDKPNPRTGERAGEKYAQQSGLPYWVPDQLGDANDHHQKHGLRSLAVALNDLRRGGVGHGSVRHSSTSAAIPGERSSCKVGSRA